MPETLTRPSRSASWRGFESISVLGPRSIRLSIFRRGDPGNSEGVPPSCASGRPPWRRSSPESAGLEAAWDSALLTIPGDAALLKPQRAGRRRENALGPSRGAGGWLWWPRPLGLGDAKAGFSIHAECQLGKVSASSSPAGPRLRGCGRQALESPACSQGRVISQNFESLCWT